MVRTAYKEVSVPYGKDQLVSVNFDDLLREAVQCDIANKAIYQQNEAIRQNMIQEAEQLWGKHSNEYKYLSRSYLPTPTSQESKVKYAQDQYKSYIEQQKREEREKKRETEAKQQLDEYRNICTKYLIEQGFTFGQDFTYENAINKAVSHKEAALLSSLKGKETSCDCDECGTFIIGDDRCTCGNRRVSLLFEGNIFVPDKYYYYTECY